MKAYVLATIIALVLVAGCAQPDPEVIDDIDPVPEEPPEAEVDEAIEGVSEDFIDEDDVELEEII